MAFKMLTKSKKILTNDNYGNFVIPSRSDTYKQI